MLGFVAGLVLAVAASVAITSAYLFQHAGAAELAPVTPRRALSSVRDLFTSPTWLWGLVLGMAGWALHVVALSLTPLSLVQAFYAGGLALAAPIAAVGFGHRLDARERRGIVLMAGALALLAVGLKRSGRYGAFADLGLAIFMGLDLLGGLLLVVAVTGRGRPAALGLASGLFYGAADTAIKASTEVLRGHGVFGVLTSPWFGFAILGTVAGFFSFQRGLQVGRALAVIGLSTASSIVVSMAAGVVVFGDPLGRGPLLGCLHVMAFAVVVVATWRLAPLQVIGRPPLYNPN